MATYNGERYIREAIDSILNQTFSDFEFIIVDDGSTDDTVQIIQSYSDERIIYIKKELNSGIADSLNLGIKASNGAYIARMDDDDVSITTRFIEQLKVFQQNEEVIFCGSNVSDNNSKPLRTPEGHDDIFLELLFRNPIFHPTVMIKKKILIDNPYKIDTVPSEDYDLWSRLIFKGKFYQIQKPLLYCRVHQASVTVNRRHEQLQQNIRIAKFMFKKLGFNNLKNHEENLSIFASKDYSISGIKLKNLIAWFKELKAINHSKLVFPIEGFNMECDEHLKQYLISFFTNRKVSKKIKPFLWLEFPYKKLILQYYLK
ncbi:MAG: glycosyltransferase [Psychroserpens sp.]|uniref:glycosyltransferase family 2 protein n=1 Tax=Psychroserpens sp. TaxID=2020870 RepID=UPI0030030A1C